MRRRANVRPRFDFGRAISAYSLTRAKPLPTPLRPTGRGPLGWCEPLNRGHGGSGGGGDLKLVRRAHGKKDLIGSGGSASRRDDMDGKKRGRARLGRLFSSPAFSSMSGVRFAVRPAEICSRLPRSAWLECVGGRRRDWFFFPVVIAAICIS